MDVIPVRGAMLDRVLDATHATQRGVLDRRAYGRFCEAQAKTAWGSRFQRRLALVDGGDLLASAEQYDLAGTCDGRAVRICGIGSLVTNPARRGRGHARVLLEALLDRATGGRAEMALLFTHAGLDDDVREGFEALPMTEVTLEVAQSPRHGAPMTMVRGGGERDLAAIVSMGRVRVGPLRFHLDREIDLVRFALTRKRLIAGLGPAGARQLHFFIVEEGITAAAYVIVSAAGGTWTLEECGDRDASGARVGALLQALIAREPVERRPVIRGWLPPGFLPPQLTIRVEAPATEAVMIRRLGTATPPLRLSSSDVLYWRNDVF